MSTRSRIPTAIEPLLRLPLEASLILLTGTLGSSPVWLTSRFVGHALNSGSNTGVEDGDGGKCSVLLVSWMRDLTTFWKNEIRRSMGYDVAKAIDKGRLSFIDCLGEHSVARDGLAALQAAVMRGIERLRQSSSQVLLVLDNPDVLLATASATAQQLNTLLLKLRSNVHSVILACSADQPLVAAATQGQQANALPLETETAKFLTQQAHNARHVISVRELATGAASDVSGVLQVTRSAGAYDSDGEEVDEMEALYLLQRDGGVKVFQRGSDAE